MLNPMQLMQLMGQLQHSNNPMGMLQQMYGNDPTMQRAIQMAQGKSPEQIMQIAQNLADQQGIDLKMMLSQIGFKY